MPRDGPVPSGGCAPALRRWFEAACTATLRLPRFARVYVGPLWELPAASSPESVVGWKLSVLSRQEGGGAENWGHLFLVLSPGGREPALHEVPDEGRPRATRGPVIGPRVLEEGPPRALLFLQPNRREFTERLSAFADELAAAFRSLGSPPAGLPGRPHTP